MLHKYRKTALIEAEQFDGTKEMKDNIFPDDNGTGFDYFLLTKEGNMKLNTGDYIATGVDGEHWAIAPEIFEKTYERVD